MKWLIVCLLMILINYSSENGMEYNNTNNDILADAQEDILNNKTDNSIKIYLFINSFKQSGGDESLAQENFSHDNWKGVAAWLAKNDPENLDEVPLLGRHSWNPVNFLTFLWMQNKVTRFLLQPLISARMVFNSIFTMKRDAQGRPHTSGRLLDYFLCKGFKLDITLAIMTWCLEKFNDLENWDNIFNIYFDSEHRYNYKVMEAYNANR